MSNDEKIMQDPRESIDLDKVINEVISESVEEKKKEAQNKIRFVLNGMNQALYRIKKSKEQIAKDEESVRKAKEKIEKIKSGDWNTLNSINLNEKETAKENKES